MTPTPFGWLLVSVSYATSTEVVQPPAFSGHSTLGGLA
jgi:hypothetical protein